VREYTEEVTAARYLAGHRPMAHLFEITPDMDPAVFAARALAPEQPDEPSAATDEPDLGTGSLPSIVRARGERETDVRLLVDDGERYLMLAHDLANQLRCDVYLTPHGSKVIYLHQYTHASGDLWEAVAVDEVTGAPVQWLVVRPLGLPDTVATWFTSTHGRLLPSHGLVTVTLPDGIAFATKTTYRDTASLATRLMPCRHRLTTVAVNADLGMFEIARFDDAGSLLDGVELATLVLASLDVVHPDVQLAMTWPRDATAGTNLHDELIRLADALGRTVWVPEPHGAAFVLPGLGEFVAVDEVGAPSKWRAYPPRLAENWTPNYETDRDGRLVPAGTVSAARFPGVPFVSVPAAQLENLRDWYAAIAPQPGLFPVDLAVLADGRLAVAQSDGTTAVAGPRELQVMLREAGWRGEELLLLAQPDAGVWNTTIDHARALVDGLRTDLWLATLGAEVWVQADGTLAADGPDGTDLAWCCVAYGHTAANVTLPAALAVPRLADDGRIVSRPALAAAVDAISAAATTVSPAAPLPWDVTVPDFLDGLAEVGAQASAGASAAVVAGLSLTEPYGLSSDPYGLSNEPYGDLTVRIPDDPAPVLEPAREPAPAGLSTGVAPLSLVDGTARWPAGALGRALGTKAPHGVPWLPESPVVNARALDLYIWTPLATDQVESWGLPSADLFLLAGQDPLRLADRRPSGYLLRVRVPEHAAVDLHEHTRHAPTAVQQRLVDTGNTHLLPLAWLKDLRVTARFDLDGQGGVRARGDVGAGALAIRFEGAEHGVPGLPNEVVHWPDKGSRADAPSYLLLPEEPGMSLSVLHNGFVALSRTKPAMEEGYRLLEVRVRRRRAVDVPATLDTLAGLNIVGRMHDFIGLDLLLPEADLNKAVVTKIWHRGTGGRTVVDKLSGETLYDALLDESILAGQAGRTRELAGAAA